VSGAGARLQGFPALENSGHCSLADSSLFHSGREFLQQATELRGKLEPGTTVMDQDRPKFLADFPVSREPTDGAAAGQGVRG
jgi:hypothetical protein